MAEIDVVNLKNEKVGKINLSDDVFGQKVNQPLVLQVIKAQLAGMRQGTASTKTKGVIRGGGKKPFRQKGTGNARQGSSRSPLMPGGGAAHGPLPRKYNQDTPRQMVQGALRCVLSDKFAAKHLVVVENFELKTHKTKALAEILSKSFNAKKALLVDPSNKNLKLASQNIPAVKAVGVDGVNPYDVVRHDWLFLSKQSVQDLTTKLGNGRSSNV